MSIAGIGSFADGNLSQMLSTLLSKLNTTSSTSSTSSTSADATTSDSATSTTIAGPLTGNTKPSLSSMILGALIGLQMQSSSGDTSSSTSSTTSSSTDPVQSLFTAMDTDGNGTVSKSELESYIGKQGGTTTEADNLYSMLDQSGNDGITESDLASQAPPPPPQGGMGGPGGMPSQAGNFATGSSDGLGNQLVSLLDTNDQGSVSKSDLESYFTSNGGTTSEADAAFSALDTTNSGSVTASDFTTAIEKLQNEDTSNPASSILSLLGAIAYNSTSSTNTVSTTA